MIGIFQMIIKLLYLLKLSLLIIQLYSLSYLSNLIEKCIVFRTDAEGSLRTFESFLHSFAQLYEIQRLLVYRYSPCDVVQLYSKKHNG